MVCSVDFETAGTVELKRTGVYPYAAHHDTRVWCMAYAFDEEEPELWTPDQPFPERLRDHIAAGGEMRAWNAAFERIVWRDRARKLYHFPTVQDAQWVCTMAEAMAMALPRSLEHAAEVLRLSIRKDMKGNKLSKQMARPRRFDEDGNPVWWDTPEKLERLYAYCRQDVRVERAISKLVNRLVPQERELYLLDQKMNDRGIALDYQLVVAAKQIVEREIDKQNAALLVATNGEVSKITQVAKLKEWLNLQGIAADSLAKKALAELLDDRATLSDDVRAALEAREEAAKSSVAKIDAMLDCVSRDNRMRGLMLYHGASTGRWAGKLVQPHNFPRPTITVKEIEEYIPVVLEGDPDNIITLNILSDMLRAMMVAAPGHVLVAADFAAIEARVLAWLANETVMLRQFREGRPIYKEMAAVIFKRAVSTIEKPSPEYQLGKNTILGCGFGMGEKKFAKTTGVDAETAELAVTTYRQSYARIPLFWKNLNEAAVEAVLHPNEVRSVGRLHFIKRGSYLWIKLPGGRALAYAVPRVVDRPLPWDKEKTVPAVEYSGVNSYNRKWERMALYGGLLAENTVSATARDLLAEAMLRCEQAGYPMVLSVHDEVVAEVAASRPTGPVLELMKVLPTWAEGCPVDAEGWVSHRYRK